MTTNQLAVAHELYGRGIPFAYRFEIAFFEVAVHPKGIGVDQRYFNLPDVCIIAELRQKIGDVAVHRRLDLCAIQVYTRRIRGVDEDLDIAICVRGNERL